jgi:hypothetical protein
MLFIEANIADHITSSIVCQWKSATEDCSSVGVLRDSFDHEGPEALRGGCSIAALRAPELGRYLLGTAQVLFLQRHRACAPCRFPS